MLLAPLKTTWVRRTIASVVVLPALLAPCPSRLAAQASETFVRQTLLVLPFHDAVDRRLGLRVAYEMRAALVKAAGREALGVAGADSAERMLKAGGVERPELARPQEIGWIARISRADEVLHATVRSFGDTIELTGTLGLVRDPRVRELLPPVRGVGRDAAAEALARLVLRARTQMDGTRACENLARSGQVEEAARVARQALARYPDGLLARNCLVRVLPALPVQRDSIIRVAEFILARDSANVIALTMRAQALANLAQTEGRNTAAARTRAVTAWRELVQRRPDTLDIGVEAVEVMLRFDRPRDALVALDTVTLYHATEPRYARLRFRALHTLNRWAEAAALGDSLDRVDAVFASDPNYAVRHVEALRMRGDTIRAVARSARAVAEHPQDGRLYVQYVELVSGENNAALARGLAKFPSLAPLRVLAAQRARASGDAGAERSALSQAVGADASLAPAYLRLAELWFQDGAADSALAVLAKAPRTGDGALMLRAYLVGRGLDQLRRSVDSIPESYETAMGFLALADSVESGDDSRSLVVAASLQQARAHLVVGATSRSCEPIQRAGTRLDSADTVIARGVGEGNAAAELREAHAGLSAAVQEAARVLCGVATAP